MATIEKFEDLKVWQKARVLSCEVYQLTHKEKFSKDFSLKDQVRRSSGSVMDNIAEGFDRNTSKEFKQFLFIAKGSLSEVKSQLYRALDQNYINQEEFEQTISRATDVGKMIGGLINYLQQKITNDRVNDDGEQYLSNNQLSTINNQLNDYE